MFKVSVADLSSGNTLLQGISPVVQLDFYLLSHVKHEQERSYFVSEKCEASTDRTPQSSLQM